MKRAAEYVVGDGNGAPLKKHDDDTDARIARIRGEIVAEQQAISSFCAAFHADLDKRQQRLATLERELLDAIQAKEHALLEREKTFELSPNASLRL